MKKTTTRKKTAKPAKEARPKKSGVAIKTNVRGGQSRFTEYHIS